MWFMIAPAALLLLGGAVFLPPKFIFQPNPNLVLPKDGGVPRAELLKFKTDDEETLVAWYAAPRDAQGPLVVYFHGQSNTLDARKDQFNNLIDHGYGLLAVAFRGFNGSTGSPSEDGFLRDAEAAYAKAIEKVRIPGRIVLMGESLGTGVATILASHHDAAALVLDSPYDNIPNVADSAHNIPAAIGNVFITDKFHADQAIGKVKAPVLMSVGKTDGSTPPERGSELFRLANPPKCLLCVDHGHITFSDPLVLGKAMTWIDATVGPTHSTMSCPSAQLKCP